MGGIYPHEHLINLIVLYVTTFTDSKASPCSGISGGVVVQDRCVWLTSGIDATQSEARAVCKTTKPEADLAVVDSEEKFSALETLASTITPGKYAWLGLIDTDTFLCRNWKWMDGRRLDGWANWQATSHEPNGLSLAKPTSTLGIQECSVVAETFKWMDFKCGSNLKYALCECCYQGLVDTKVIQQMYRRTMTTPSGTPRNQVRCAVTCASDPNCCTFTYKPQTGDCEYNSLSVSGQPSGEYIREQAHHP